MKKLNLKRFMRQSGSTNLLLLFLFTVLGLILSAGAVSAQQNTVSTSEVALAAGQTKPLQVTMDNTSEIVAVQFTLTVPEGISLNTSSAQGTSRCENHRVAVRYVDEGKYTFVILSTANAVITGNSGKLLDIDLTADEDLSVETVLEPEMSNVILSLRNGDNAVTSFSAGEIRITQAPDITIHIVGEGYVGIDGSAYSDGDTYPADYEETVTLYANAEDGYRFVKWDDDSTNPERTITVTEDMTVTATFEEIPYYTIHVIADPSDGGSVDVWQPSGYPIAEDGEWDEGDERTWDYWITVYENTEVGIWAAALEGYRFLGWYDGETQVYGPEYNSQNIYFTPAEDKTYTAKFEEIPQYDVTISIVGNGYVTIYGDAYPDGEVYTTNDVETVTLYANAEEGYRFVKWDDDSTNPERTITFTEDMTVTATFEALPKVTFDIVGEGYVGIDGSTYSDGDTYPAGYEETITLYANAEEGYRFVKWDDNSTNPERTITVTEDMTVTATFEEIIIPNDELALLRTAYEKMGNGEGWNRPWDLSSTAAVRESEDFTVSDGHITGIDMSGNNIYGALPEELFQLPYLEWIDASDNHIDSLETMPDEGVNLTIDRQDLTHKVYLLDLTQGKTFEEVFPNVMLYFDDDARFYADDGEESEVLYYNYDEHRIRSYYSYYGYYPYTYTHADNEPFVARSYSGEISFGLRILTVNGDADFNALFDINDLQSVVNYLFNEYPDYGVFNLPAADFYADNRITVQDAVRMVDSLLVRNEDTDDLYLSPRRNKQEEDMPQAVLTWKNGELHLNALTEVAAMDLVMDNAEIEWLLPSTFDVSTTVSNGRLHAVVWSLSGDALPAMQDMVIARSKNRMPDIRRADMSDRKARPVTAETQTISSPTGTETLSAEGISSWVIYDMTARRIASGESASGLMDAARSLPQGVYTVQMENGNQTISRKITIQ